jgi:hypothetical protein
MSDKFKDFELELEKNNPGLVNYIKELVEKETIILLGDCAEGVNSVKSENHKNLINSKEKIINVINRNQYILLVSAIISPIAAPFIVNFFFNF